MMRILDRCKQQTTDTGVSDLTLGTTPSGFRALTAVYTAGDRFLYVIQHQETSEWEVGIGYLSASDVVREQPLAGSAATPVSFSSGIKDVFVAHEGKLSAAIHAAQFGDGSDGDFVASSGTTVLDQNKNYRNITISGTGLLIANGWKIRWSGVCDLSNATITRAIGMPGGGGGPGLANGTAGAGTTGPAGETVGHGGSGANGGAGGVAAGSNGSAASNLGNANGGASGAAGAGAGGAGSGGAGGTGNAGGLSTGFTRFGPLEPLVRENAGVASYIMGGAGGGGGGGGGGDGTAGGGGGGGGAGGGVLDLAGAVLKVSSSTVAGVIECTGGGGGNGGTPAAGNRGGGGGGSAGGGGYLRLVVGTLIGSKAGALSATGGAGGAGGTKSGTGVVGSGGAGGAGGTIHYFNLTAGSRVEVVGAAGGNPSGVSGGAGGASNCDL